MQESLGVVSKDGLVRKEHYQPAKSHDIGYVDGKLTDWVGIWVHQSAQ